MRIQFVLKRNDTYSFKSYSRRSSGLWNSTRYIVEALRALGVECDIVEVVDNNSIDREVSRFNPDICVIEALWVVPEKFDVLKRLHPRVRWFVHLHSNVPFLALEGIAIQWLVGYAERGVGCIANSHEAYKAIRVLIGGHAAFLPNVYVSEARKPVKVDHLKGCVDVACLGAIRPLKNQLIQALAAIKFARQIGRRVRFHVNATRVETNGDPVLKNLRALFLAHGHEAMLVEHPWLEPEDLIHFLSTKVDIGMQVSLSETFNVVTADYLTAGLPVVVSKEIKWVNRWSKAEDDDIDDIVKVMARAWRWRCLIRWNQRLLKWWSQESTDNWFDFIWSVTRGLR